MAKLQRLGSVWISRFQTWTGCKICMGLVSLLDETVILSSISLFGKVQIILWKLISTITEKLSSHVSSWPSPALLYVIPNLIFMGSLGPKVGQAYTSRDRVFFPTKYYSLPSQPCHWHLSLQILLRHMHWAQLLCSFHRSEYMTWGCSIPD